ncbi:MAG: hypothetical protein ACXW5U_17680 [Thermoanaerobaculia bacterium]
MGHEKLRIHNTQLDNLVSNLRGEVGEIVASWILMRDLRVQASRRRSQPGVDEFGDHELSFLHTLSEKLEDEIVARVSELAESKVGRLTFHFAYKKTGKVEAEVRRFQKSVQRKRLTERRNSDIAHKELPETWTDHRHLSIPYRDIVHAIVMAFRLMKKFDRAAVGPEARFFWQKLRQGRYAEDKKLLPKVAYGIASHIRLEPHERIAVINDELREGRKVWEPMQTLVNGQPATVPVNKKWAVVLLGPQLMVLDVYPLQELKSIDFDPSPEGGVPDPTTPQSGV